MTDVHSPVLAHIVRDSPLAPAFSKRRSGFSLLEVILALTILAGAVAVLGEVARHGLDTARIARDLTYAQLLCESQLAEITSGLSQPDSVERAQVDAVADPNQTGWLYSVEVESTDVDGLLAVRVTVMQDLPEEKHPVRCSLVRWMQDPDATFTSNNSTSQGSSSSGSSSDSSTSGSSGTGTGSGSGSGTGGGMGGGSGSGTGGGSGGKKK